MKKKLFIFFISFCALNTIAQVYPIKNYVSYPPTGGTREMIDNVPSALDISNNAIYISGFTRNVTTLRDYTLIKFDTNGVFQWQKSFNYTGLNDRALAITIDNSGNPIITGEATSLTNGTDIVTRKYDMLGNLLWSVTYNGSANSADAAFGVVADNSGDVYVCGYTSNTGTGKDFTVIKYNSSGTQQFVYTKNGTANGDDMANAIAFFGNKLYVTGNISNTGTGADIYTTRLNANNANVNWFKIENGTANLNDQSLDIKVQGNDVMVCGGITNTGTNQDYFFAKYNASNGSSVFPFKTYDAFGANDFATSLVLDASNTYAMVGVAQNGTNYEYHATKYSNSGVFSWVSRHKTNSNSLNTLPKIAVDVIANHFYVSGLTLKSTLDALVYQITPGGNQTWVDYHDGFGMRDANVDLLVDNFGRVYVASLNEQSPNIFNIALIQYKQRPLIIPIDFNNVNEPFSYTHLFYPHNNLIKDETGVITTEATFFTRFAYPQEFICKNSVAFCEYSPDSSSTGNDSVSRVNMVFDGANEFSQVYPYYYQGHAKLNYYLDYTGPNGCTDVQGSSRLICPNIYTDIDLHYFSNTSGAKYYFVLQPGADPNQIKIRFDGAQSTSITGNDLQINSPLGSWTFKNPKVYNITPGPVTPAAGGTTGWASLGGDTYKINTGTYSSVLTLVIEFDKGASISVAANTNIDWSTYMDAGAGRIVDVVKDASNNIYVCGMTTNPSLPKVTGIQLYSAAGDGFIAKFDPNATLIWSAYTGGSNFDEITSLDIDPVGGNVFAIGLAQSTNIILKNKASATFNNAYGGAPNDGFITELNPSGTFRNWFTYLGCSGGAFLTKCKFDVSGNFFIIGHVGAGLPILKQIPTSYSSGYVDLSGTDDGYIMKLANGTSANLWSTYIGSSFPSTCSNDFLFDLDFNGIGDLYVAGRTIGSNYPIVTPVGSTTFGQHSSCMSDAIATRFTNSGQILWSSYFGTTGNDGFHAVQTLGFGGLGVFFGGYSDAVTAFTGVNSSNLYFNTTKAGFPGTTGGTFYQFDNANLLIHSTLIGGSGNDIVYDIVTDGLNNFYLLGATTSPALALPPSGNPPNTYGLNPKGGSDYFIFTTKLGNTSPVWSSIIGGTGSEGTANNANRYVNGVVDNTNRLHLTGGTNSSTNFEWDYAGVGTHWKNSLSGGLDGSITRFDLNNINMVGINEYAKASSNLLVYPNPAQTSINIKSNSFQDGSFIIYNSLGQTVLSGKLLNSTTNINISNLMEGIYFLEVFNKETKMSSKFVRYD